MINKEWVGKDAGRILEVIGVTRAPGAKLIIADVPEDHPLVWTEQLMPVRHGGSFQDRVSQKEPITGIAGIREHGGGHPDEDMTRIFRGQTRSDLQVV